MYKPAANRRWGYYALPILYGDRLVGKLDAPADRKAGILRVSAIHQDVPFTKPMGQAINREVEDLARWLALDLELAGLTACSTLAAGAAPAAGSALRSSSSLRRDGTSRPATSAPTPKSTADTVNAAL